MGRDDCDPQGSPDQVVNKACDTWAEAILQARDIHGDVNFILGGRDRDRSVPSTAPSRHPTSDRPDTPSGGRQTTPPTDAGDLDIIGLLQDRVTAYHLVYKLDRYRAGYRDYVRGAGVSFGDYLRGVEGMHARVRDLVRGLLRDPILDRAMACACDLELGLEEALGLLCQSRADPRAGADILAPAHRLAEALVAELNQIPIDASDANLSILGFGRRGRAEDLRPEMLKKVTWTRATRWPDRLRLAQVIVESEEVAPGVFRVQS